MTKSVKLFILAFFAIVASASAAPVDMAAGFEVPAVIENGDTIPLYTLPVVTVFPDPSLVYTDGRKRQIFWRIVRDVKKTYPYARMIAAEVNKVDASTRGMSESQRKAYMKKHENDLVDKFKPQLRTLTFRQGKMLIKLVDRECNKTSYDLIKEYRGSFRAFFWQGFARLLGADLNSSYDKDENQVIETVIEMVEAGRL